MTDLAKRLLACPRFRWMPGMHANAGRVLDVRGAEICLADEGATEDGNTVRWVDSAGLGPYLTDPATLGCLLALVEERYGDGCYVQNLNGGLYGDGWVVFIDDQALTERHQTRVHALVAALEAA